MVYILAYLLARMGGIDETMKAIKKAVYLLDLANVGASAAFQIFFVD